jgi:hypothetical protein
MITGGAMPKQPEEYREQQQHSGQRDDDSGLRRHHTCEKEARV